MAGIIIAGKSEKEETLPYTPEMQLAAFGHMLTNPAFLYQCKGRVMSNWFVDKDLGALFNILMSFVDRTQNPPTPSELKNEIVISGREIAEKNKWNGMIDYSISITKEFSLENIQQQFSAWVGYVRLQEAIYESADLLNKIRTGRENISVALPKFMDTTMTRLNDYKINTGDKISWRNTREWIIARQEDKAMACTTGLRDLDRALLKSDNPDHGGLMPGETTVFLAPVNVGKTLTLITIIKHNILKGKSILWLTHEDHPKNLTRKMLFSMLERTEEQTVAMYNEPSSYDEILKIEDQLANQLDYVPYNKAAGMYVEDVILRIQREQAARKQKTGKGYDLIVDDYPSRLSVRGGKDDPLRFRLGRIYDAFVQLAIEEGLHCVLAMQSNRTASREARTGERIIVVEDSGESFEVPQKVSNVVTITRSAENMATNTTVLFVDKTRQNERSRNVITCRSRFDLHTVFSDKYGVASVQDLYTEALVNGAFNNGKKKEEKLVAPIDPIRDSEGWTVTTGDGRVFHFTTLEGQHGDTPEITAMKRNLQNHDFARYEAASNPPVVPAAVDPNGGSV